MKGASGNPAGLRVIAREVKELAREYGPAAILRLAQLMRSPDGVIAIAACRELLNRGYGRPEATINLPNGGALVNITLGNQPIATAEEAAAAYHAILGNPTFDFSQLSFAPTELSEEPTSDVAAPSARDPAEAAPATAPGDAPLPDNVLNLWERLGK